MSHVSPKRPNETELGYQRRIADTLAASKPDAFTAFYANPSPANAVALAISDHKAGKLVDWPFVDQLNRARDICEAHPDLVAALRAMLKEWPGPTVEQVPTEHGHDWETVPVIAQAQAILAKLPPQSP